MAQKETSSKSRRWLGLSGAAVLVANLVLTGTTIAFQQEGEVNHALGIEGSDASYGGTEFSADGSLSDASYAKYIEAAYQFCEQEEEEGSVLLYNRNNALPLSESERNVTVFGRGSIDPVFRSTAGGSSTNPDYQKTPVDALQDAGFNVNQTVLDAYASADAPKERSVSSVGEYDPALFTGSVTDSFASYGDVAFVTLSRFATEGNDLAMVNDEGKRMLELDDNEKAIFQKIKDSGKFKKTVVLLNSVFAMEMDWLDEYNVDAVLWVGNPGFYGMPGAIRVVTGEVNPSGHTTATFAANSLSAPSAENFGLHAYNYGSKTPRAAGDSFVSYNEGIYVGYRYYETRYEDTILGQGNADSTVGTKASTDGWNYAEEVCFPFGYGLSYTNYEYSLDKLDYNSDTDTFTATVTVSNTGDMDGKATVELYGQSPYTDYDKQNNVEKSSIQLLGYDKIDVAAGASETVTVDVPGYFLASYDANGAKGYILDAGDYYFAVGNGAHEALNNVLAAKCGDAVAGKLIDQDGNASIPIAYAPGADTLRSPYSGRTSEYFSEDGVLSYYAAKAVSRGMRNKGLIGTVKHFFLNEQEAGRQGISTFANEQSIREIYMRAFEGSLAEGDSLGVMTAYNRIGVMYAAANQGIQHILRDEWNYGGYIIDDALTASEYSSAPEMLMAGNNIFCLDTARPNEIEKLITSTDDGDLLQKVIDSNHYLYYVMLQSSMGGSGAEDVVVSDAAPWWQTTLRALDAVFCALAVAAVVMYVMPTYTDVFSEEKRKNRAAKKN